MTDAIVTAGYTPGDDAAISLDIAASDLYDPATQRYSFRLDNQSFTAAQFADLLIAWCGRYPIVSIETRWRIATGKLVYSCGYLSHRIQLIGDDLFTTICSGSAPAFSGKLPTPCSSSLTRSAPSLKRWPQSS